MSHRSIVLGLLLAGTGLNPLSAQTTETIWEQAAGPEGAQVVGFAQLPDGEILASARASGVFRSRDAGQTWERANGNLAVDYGSGGIWMGPVVADDAGYAYLINGWGVFRGERVNNTWNWAFLPDEYPARRRPIGASDAAIMTRDGHPQRVFVAAWTYEVDPDGAQLWSPCVSYTDDHGETWNNVPLPVGAVGPALGVTVSPNGHVWATTAQAVYRSEDGGDTWNEAYQANDFPSWPGGWSAVRTFAGPIAASPLGDVYVSFYEGEGILRIPPNGTAEKFPNAYFCYFVTSFAFGENGTIYAGTYQNSGVWYSTDRGENWLPLGTYDGTDGVGGFRSIWAVSVLPDGTLLSGSYGDGVLRLPPGEQTWAYSKRGMVGTDVVAIAADRQGSIYAGTIGAGLFRSDDQGQTWTSLAPQTWVGDTISARDLAFDDQGTVFVAWHALAVSTDRGASWVNRWVGEPGGTQPADPGATPMATRLLRDPQGRLIVGTSQGVYFTSDGGLTWQRGGLHLPVYSIALSPDGLQMAATTTGSGPDDGLYRSFDAGANWIRDPFWESTRLLDVALSADGTLFVGPSGLPDGQNPGIWRLRHGEANWTKLTGDYSPYGLPVSYVYGSMMLLNADNQLFVADGDRIAVSPDGGDTWESWSTGLADVPVRSLLDLSFDADGYCLLGTWGAGAFRSRESTAPFTPVAIDLRDEATEAKIVLHSKGLLRVTIAGSATFDARTVDPSSVTLAGAVVRQTRSGRWMASLEDRNQDGHLDLVLHFSIPDLDLEPTDTEVTLLGKTYSGRSIRGTDHVRVVD